MANRRWSHHWKMNFADTAVPPDVRKGYALPSSLP
jgi:hypothetical protein